MQCVSCTLRFSSQKRTPYVLNCGHSICKLCTSETNSCPVCKEKDFEGKLIQVNASSLKVNHSIMEFVEKQRKNIDKFLKICFVGSASVGKTSLIRLLTGEKFIVEVPTTIGYDFAFVDRKIADYTVRFQLWDSAGQEKFRAISPIHYKNSDLVVIAFDATEKDEFNKVEFWLEEVEKNCEKSTEVVLICNKIDMREQPPTVVLNPTILKEIEQGRLKYLEVSCKIGEGSDKLWLFLEKVFQEGIKKGSKRKQNAVKSVIIASTVPISQPRNNGSCC